jgi:hypothetical protein
VGSLLGGLASLRIQSLLDEEAASEYGQDEPALELEVTLEGGDVLTYRLWKPEDEDYYVLERSDHDHYFQVAEFTAKRIEDAQREKLVSTTVEGDPGEAGPDESIGDVGEATTQPDGTLETLAIDVGGDPAGEPIAEPVGAMVPQAEQPQAEAAAGALGEAEREAPEAQAQ